MKDFSYTVAFLTPEGAQRMFGRGDIAGLPVIPTKPVLVNDTIVYGDIYCHHNGERIGSTLSQSGFTDQSPPQSNVEAAIDAYEKHSDYMAEEFGHERNDFRSVEELLAIPQEDIPTLEEAYPLPAA